MGTRALVRFYTRSRGEKVEASVVQVYFSWDGYPAFIGVDLALFLLKITLVNGVPGGSTNEEIKYANGPGCLVAQYIARRKVNALDVKVYGMEFPFDMIDIDFIYDVTTDWDKLRISEIAMPLQEKVFTDIRQFGYYCQDYEY